MLKEGTGGIFQGYATDNAITFWEISFHPVFHFIIHTTGLPA
jgi:hypothetical protein